MKKGRPQSPFRADCRAHMFAGGAPKEFAFKVGFSRESAQKLATAVGYRKYFLTEVEYADVLVRRREFAKRKAAS